MTDLYKVFKEGRKRLQEKGKEDSQSVTKYKEMLEDKDKLFDVFLQDKSARLNLQDQWGVTMSPKEFIYYEDQKKDRKMYCSR